MPQHSELDGHRREVFVRSRVRGHADMSAIRFEIACVVWIVAQISAELCRRETGDFRQMRSGMLEVRFEERPIGRAWYAE